MRFVPHHILQCYSASHERIATRRHRGKSKLDSSQAKRTQEPGEARRHILGGVGNHAWRDIRWDRMRGLPIQRWPWGGKLRQPTYVGALRCHFHFLDWDESFRHLIVSHPSYYPG